MRGGPRRLDWNDLAPPDLFEHMAPREETSMPNQPRPDNRAHTIRVADELWEAAVRRAEERGESVSEAVRRFLARYAR